MSTPTAIEINPAGSAYGVDPFFDLASASTEAKLVQRAALNNWSNALLITDPFRGVVAAEIKAIVHSFSGSAA